MGYPGWRRDAACPINARLCGGEFGGLGDPPGGPSEGDLVVSAELARDPGPGLASAASGVRPELREQESTTRSAGGPAISPIPSIADTPSR